MNRVLLEPGEDIPLECAFPYILQVYFVDSWVTLRYALTEDDAKEFMYSTYGANVTFAIHENPKYSPDVKNNVVKTLETYLDALKS